MVIPVYDPEASLRILFPDVMAPLDRTRATLIFHTMSGYLYGTESTFSTNGPYGVRSHYGVGGPYDGHKLDGFLLQWERTNKVAQAQWDGNPFGISVETSDGGRSNPTPPWSPKQLATLTALAVRYAKWCGVTVLRECPTSRGMLGTIGWHSLFPSWNQSNHDCPSAARVDQIRSNIIPNANTILGGTVSASGPESWDTADWAAFTGKVAQVLRLPSTGLAVPHGQVDNGNLATLLVGMAQGETNRMRAIELQLDALNTQIQNSRTLDVSALADAILNNLKGRL